MDGSATSAQDFATTEGCTIRLLTRHGSRLALDLADPWGQAASLAQLLRPGAQPVTLRLGGGSSLVISPDQVVGVEIPPGDGRPPPPRTGTDGGGEILTVGVIPVLRIRDFLPPAVAEGLYQHALARRTEFQRSDTIPTDPDYRKSLVLYSFAEYQAMFCNALRTALPHIRASLGTPDFELADIECQLTATSHQEYFRPHNDNGGATPHRVLTFIYYFHRQPRPFSGGELRLFDWNPFAPQADGVRRTLDLPPEHNSFVVFDSSCFHEVCSVVCDAPAFENSRFTVNGWLCNAKAAS